MQSGTQTGGHTLQRKVAIIVVAGLVASFGLFGFLALEAVQESTQAVFQERLMMAQVTADHIDFELREALDYLQTLSRANPIDLYDGRPESKRALLAEARAHLPIFAQQVYLVDRNGTVLMVEPAPSPLEGTNLFDYVHIQRILEGARAEVSGAILNPVTRKPEVALAVSITDRTGRTVGVLGASADIARASLAGLILGLKPGRTGHTQILDGNGTVMASTEPGFVLRRSHHHDLLFSLIRQKSAQVVSHSTEEGVDTLREVVAFAPLSHASWGVSVEQEETEALAVGRDLAIRLLGLGLLSLVGALATGAVVLRSVLIPIRSLTLASERIAAGDLDGPPLIAGEAEVGRLASTFETMRLRLRQSREELDSWHRELELRVQQRTSELSCLFELSKTIAASTDLDNMIWAVVRKVVEVLEPADAAYLYLEDPDHHRLILRAWHGDLPAGLDPYYLEVASLAFHSRRPVHCASTEASLGLEKASPAPLPQREAPNSSALEAGVLTCAPLLTQSRALGALLLRCSSPIAGHNPPDLALVQALADQAAVAIERAQLAREAEQAAALREADRLKSLFISTITHELQSPLGFIKGYATTLLRPHADFDEKTRREFLEIINEESDSLSALIDDLLDVSRIEAGALAIEKQPVPLAKLMRRSVERVRAKLDRHDLILRLPARLPPVEADPQRLEQVLRNLLDNAVKYSPEGGTVTLSAWAQEGSVVVSVADQGIGILSEEQGRVFERFYRATGAASASRRGVGLGLSICRGIVEAHGGRIWLESQLGRGTTVYFSIPVGQGTPSPALPRNGEGRGRPIPRNGEGKGCPLPQQGRA